MVSAAGLIEKLFCSKCGIVFDVAGECPRCGKSDALSVFLEFADS